MMRIPESFLPFDPFPHVHDSNYSVIDLVNCSIPLPRKLKKKGLGTNAFSAHDHSFSNDYQRLAERLLTLRRPQSDDLGSCLSALTLKARKDLPRSICYPANQAAEAEIRLPLWVLSLWQAIDKFETAQSVWQAATSELGNELGDNASELSALLQSIQWNYPVCKELSASVSDLAAFCTTNWLSDVNLDLMATIINLKANAHGLSPRRIIERAAFSNKLISQHRHEPTNYCKGPNLKFIRDTGKQMQAGALDMLGLFFSVIAAFGSEPARLPNPRERGNHWVAVVVNVPKQLILYADPLNPGGKPPSELFLVTSWWLDHHFKFNFRLSPLDCNTQPDSFSCGVMSVNAIAHHFQPLMFPLIYDKKTATESRRLYLSSAIEAMKSPTTAELARSLRTTSPKVSPSSKPEDCTNPASSELQTSPTAPHAASPRENNTHPEISETAAESLTPSTPPIRLGKRPASTNVESESDSIKRLRLNFVLPPLGLTVETDLDSNELPFTQPGYISKKEDTDSSNNDSWHNEGTFEDLISLSWRHIRWDGKTARPLLDDSQRVFGVLAGQPEDRAWNQACGRVCQKMKRISEEASFAPAQTTHKRGQFAAVNVGVGQGHGAPEPHTLSSPSIQQKKLMDELLNDPDVQLIAEVQDAMLAGWAPKLHQRYKSTLQKLWDYDCNRPDGVESRLRPTFKNSAWPTAAFNFGGEVWCFQHRDSKDFAHGWCAIIALGIFDWNKGGHLVLSKLEMMIEFPPGSVILIPSSLLAHGNTLVSTEAGEYRFSFTQYCPGALLRYVDNDFKPVKEIDEPTSIPFSEPGKERGLTLWSTFQDLFNKNEASKGSSSS